MITADSFKLREMVRKGILGPAEYQQAVQLIYDLEREAENNARQADTTDGDSRQGSI